LVTETLIKHPENLNRQTLYELRKITAEYPYYQPARILLLKNLFLLHDPTFDDELRRAAIFLTDRKVLFDLVEAAHYGVKEKHKETTSQSPGATGSRMASLIDDFLNNIPDDEEEAGETRKPTVVDAKNDYMSYLLSIDAETQKEESQSLDIIDEFLNNAGGKLTLKDKPEYIPEVAMVKDGSEDDGDVKEDVLTENMANIYIQQGRYDQALKVLQAVHKKSKKKNPYYKDQERFLQKLIISQQK
jgi:tetratricopeptide (TPR) repeat protein